MFLCLPGTAPFPYGTAPLRLSPHEREARRAALIKIDQVLEARTANRLRLRPSRTGTLAEGGLARMKRLSGFALAGVLTLAALFSLGPAQAFAAQVSCGQVITQDTRVDNDLIDCPG